MSIPKIMSSHSRLLIMQRRGRCTFSIIFPILTYIDSVVPALPTEMRSGDIVEVAFHVLIFPSKNSNGKHDNRSTCRFSNRQDYFTQTLTLAPRSNTDLSFALISTSPILLPSLSRLLVQALGDALLSIISQLNDYWCTICTNIAFKPIRLGCGHLFCYAAW